MSILSKESSQRMGLYSLPLSVSFFETVAGGWLSAGEKGGMILVPSQRARRHLQEAFLRVLDGKAFFLPQITVLGELEKKAPAGVMAEIMALPPAISRLERTAVLSALVKKFQEKSALNAEQARISGKNLWALAESLGNLIDEADRAEIPLAQAVAKAKAESVELAAHWEDILRFLEIVTSAWPDYLEANGLLDPVRRESESLKLFARKLADIAPEEPLWAVGFIDGSSGVGAFLSAVCRLKRGRVVLRDVGRVLSEEIWESLPPSHPQFLFKELLGRIGAERADFQEWELPFYAADGKEIHRLEAQTGRERFWREVFSPRMSMPRGESGPLPFQPPAQTFILEAGDGQQEARAIAMEMRNNVEQRQKTVALITPDRQLAFRVSAALKRFGIIADDSAGASLSATPSAVFLRLVIAAASSHFEPVPLLSLLKHPLASLGMERRCVLSLTRLLEMKILRGAPLDRGIAPIRRKISLLQETERLGFSQAHALEELDFFLLLLEQAFAPLSALLENGGEQPVSALLEAVIATAQNCSLTSENKAQNAKASAEEEYLYALWQLEGGNALANHLRLLLEIAPDIPDQELEGFDGFLTQTMSGISLTGLRNYLGGEEQAHPRVFILGILEARALSFDTVILGGMNEGVWPPFADCGPWMGRLMRKQGGLFLPERRLGAFAQDFQAFACGSGKVIFSRSKSNAEKPEIKAPWLVRAQALMGNQNFPQAQALCWAEALDSAKEVRPAKAPEPTPPLAFRPRRLNVTAIGQLMAYPYGIYARHILKLSKLKGLGAAEDALDFGNLVHQSLAAFFARKKSIGLTREECAQLLAVFQHHLAQNPARESIKSWWRPRLEKIVTSVESYENGLVENSERRREREIFTEMEMAYVFPEINFLLTGRADRVDIFEQDGKKEAVIFDYKTGAVPSLKQVLEDWAPQLVLEGAVMEKGGFFKDRNRGETLPALSVKNLIYWQLKGVNSSKKTLLSLLIPEKKEDEQCGQIKTQMDQILQEIGVMIRAYDSIETAYNFKQGGGAFDDYALLARKSEWW